MDNSKKEFSAVVFDMDGVILDTERLSIEAWQRLAEEDGLGDMRPFFMQTLGKFVDEIKEMFRERYGYDGYEDFRQRTFDWVNAHSPNGYIPLREGAKELLVALKERGIKIGLATATEKELVLEDLENNGIRAYFDTLWTGDMVAHAKPDPALFLGACHDLGVDPADAYGIEDGAPGVQAIRAAGMRAILAEDQYHPTDEIRALCEIVLPTLGDVQRYLLG